MRHPMVFILTLTFLCVCLQPLQAEIITFYLGDVVDGWSTPDETAPWLSASFDDHDSTGSVTLTLTCLNLSDNEYVSNWLFNLDSALDPGKLRFSSVVGNGAFSLPKITAAANWCFGANGDKFDIAMNFSTSSRDESSKLFDDGDVLTITITGISSLTAESFNVASSGRCHASGVKTEAYIQGLGQCGNHGTWVETPEPSTFTLFGMWGVTFLSFFLRRRR